MLAKKQRSRTKAVGISEISLGKRRRRPDGQNIQLVEEPCGICHIDHRGAAGGGYVRITIIKPAIAIGIEIFRPADPGLFGSAPGRLVKVASEAKGSSAGVWR
jgi:hypothetical protein